MQPSYLEVTEFVRLIQRAQYRIGARGYDYVDCYGILWLYWRDVCGVELESWSGDYRRSDSRDTSRCIVRGLQEFERVDTPQLGDAVLFKSKHWHVALVLNERNFLHIDKGQNPHVADLRKLDLGGNYTAATGKKQGFYRPLQHEQIQH